MSSLPVKPSPPEKTPAIKTPQELVHIKHRITLRQYKYWVMILKSYREAYEGKLAASDGGFRYIPIRTVTEYLGYEPNRAELRADLEALRKEAIIYNVLGKDGKEAQRGAGFISEWEVSANWMGYKLPDFLVKCIERLDLKNTMFQQLNWSVFNSFSGKYEAILYKLCKDYVGVRRTPYMPIAVFREYMGLTETEYAEFKDLNKFVISGPLKKINESNLADIEIALDPRKEGRRVVGVQFLVSPKAQMAFGFGDDPAFAAARVTISLAQQQQYLAAHDASEIAMAIERANLYADEQAGKGKEVNIGAVYKTAITQGWGIEHQSKLEADAKKREKQAKDEQARLNKAKRVEAEQHQKAAEYGERVGVAKAKYDSLPESDQDALIQEFGATLTESFQLAAYRKSGITTILIRKAFEKWLIQRLG